MKCKLKSQLNLLNKANIILLTGKRKKNENRLMIVIAFRNSIANMLSIIHTYIHTYLFIYLIDKLYVELQNKP